MTNWGIRTTSFKKGLPSDLSRSWRIRWTVATWAWGLIGRYRYRLLDAMPRTRKP